MGFNIDLKGEDEDFTEYKKALEHVRFVDVTSGEYKYELPPDLWELVLENSSCPPDAVDIYDILCQEIEKQVNQARDNPEEDGRFERIMQCALILQGTLRQDVAVELNRICKECFEPLDDYGVCDNQKCKLYMVE